MNSSSNRSLPLESMDFGFLATCSLSWDEVIALFTSVEHPFRRHAAIDIPEPEVHLATVHLEYQIHGRSAVPVLVNISAKPSETATLLGMFLPSGELASQLELSELLTILLDLVKLSKCRYLVAGDEDRLGDWSASNPLCPHLVGIYAIDVAKSLDLINVNKIVGNQYTCHQRDSYLILLWNQQFQELPDQNSIELTKEAFQPFSRTWKSQMAH